MATSKKASAKGAEKKGEYEKSSNTPPSAKELSTTIKRAQDIASGKKKGAIIVLEQFTDPKGREGIQGMSYWSGMDAKSRVATLLSVAGMPAKVFLLMATLMGGSEDHEHDEKGNCIK